MALVEALQLSYLFLLVSPGEIEVERGHSDLGLLPSPLLLPLSRCEGGDSEAEEGRAQLRESSL